MEIPWWWYYYVRVAAVGPTEIRFISELLRSAAVVSGVFATAGVIGESLSVPNGTVRNEGLQIASIVSEATATARVIGESIV